MDKPVTKQELIEVLNTVLDDRFAKERVITREETKQVTKQIFEEAFAKERVFAEQKLNGAVEAIMETLGHLQDSIDDMKPQTDLVEKHDRRIETVEKRTTILKKRD